MAAATAMDLNDRRLSVSKSSSSRISKPSSVAKKLGNLLPASAASSRAAPTFVNTDTNSFRRVVQELTGTPPPSTSSSPVRDNAKPSRLQRIAPPPLRPIHHQQDQQNQHLLQQQQQQRHQQASDLPPFQQQHHQYMQYDFNAQNSIQRQHNQSWPPTLGPFSPPIPYTQVSNPNHSPYSNPNPSHSPQYYQNTNSLALSPHLLSPLPALTPGDNTWANPLDVIPSPRPVSNSASLLSPSLPSPSMNGSSQNGSNVFEWPSSSAPTSHGHPLLPSSSSGQALLPSHLPPSPGAPIPLPPFSPSASFYPHSHPSPHAAFPFSPTSGFSWLPPWSP
eukprot:c32930_g1_i1 orf=1-999(-)